MFVKKKVIFGVVIALVLAAVVSGLKPFTTKNVFAQTNPPQITGENKFGLNVAARVDHARPAAPYINSTQKNGWIGMMPNAADNYNNFDATRDEITGSYFSLLGSDFKYILRGHNPNNAATFPDKGDSQWANKWADFWARIIRDISVPAGAELYFIPWNEPNLERECNGIGNAASTSDTACVPYVKTYISALRAKFAQYGVSGKVKLLSPAMAVSAPNFVAFSNALGAGSFYNSFDGVAFDYYDFETGCGTPFCNPNPLLNPSKFEEAMAMVGATGDMYMVETGLVSPNECGPGVPDCPNFIQPDITKMLCELNKKIVNKEIDPNNRLKMFSPLTYDPEPKPGGTNQGDWFFDTDETRNFYMSRTTDCSNFGRSSKISALYGRDPYNRIKSGERYFAMSSPSCGAISSDQYSENRATEDFKLCLAPGSKEGVTSCPDYSPNRPYPGDTCIDFMFTDQDNMTKFNQEVFPIGEKQTVSFCSKDTGVCGPDTQTVSTAGRSAVFYKNSFVDFLGTNNEYTSSPNYVMSLENNIKRVSLFLTDFLGGEVAPRGIVARNHEMKDLLDAFLAYQAALLLAGNNQDLVSQAAQVYQAKLAAIPNLTENLQITSGFLGKATPDALQKKSPAEQISVIERWVKANVKRNAGDFTDPSKNYGTNPENIPIGDYVIAYKCADDLSDPVFLNEDEFPDTLERRVGTNSRTKANCENIAPIRISDFVCSPEIGASGFWNGIDFKTMTGGFELEDVCRGKEDPDNPNKTDKFKAGATWRPEDLEVIKQYFLTSTTHEDVPVRVVMLCPSNGNPDGLRLFPGELEESDMRLAGVDKYAVRGQDVDGIPQFMLYSRQYIYVGHLAEARELAVEANLLFPETAQPASFDFSEDELTAFNSNVVNQIKDAVNASSKGDLIAEDAWQRAVIAQGPQAAIEQIYTGYEIKKTVSADTGAWTAAWVTGERGRDLTKNVDLTANCEVSVEIPYLKEVAARTIGKTHGIYRLFFPEDQIKAIETLIAESPNKGVSAASSQYSVEGGGAGEKEAKLFLPWVDAMKTWNSFLNVAGNPLSLQKAIQAGANRTPGTVDPVPPDTEANSCLTQGVSFTDRSYEPAQLDKMFRCYSGTGVGNECEGVLSYPNSALNKTYGIEYGKRLWDRLINTAVAGGLNPHLALAYWGEETHFTGTNTGENPIPKKALGCGAFPDGTSCIVDGTGLNKHDQEFTDEFRCFAAANPIQIPKKSCNNACLTQPSTFDLIGCYQNGAGNLPSSNHLRNLMIFYHRLKGDTIPMCP